MMMATIPARCWGTWYAYGLADHNHRIAEAEYQTLCEKCEAARLRMVETGRILDDRRRSYSDEWGKFERGEK